MDGEVLVGDLEEYDSGYESEGSARRDRSGHAHRPSDILLGGLLLVRSCAWGPAVQFFSIGFPEIPRSLMLLEELSLLRTRA